MLLLTVLAPFAVMASEMPRAVAWPLAGIAMAAGLRDARREALRKPRVLEFRAGEGTATLDGTALVASRVSWRGPLAFLEWRDGSGRSGRLSWWPDTLPAAQRRALRLAGDALR